MRGVGIWGRRLLRKRDHRGYHYSVMPRTPPSPHGNKDVGDIGSRRWLLLLPCSVFPCLPHLPFPSSSVAAQKPNPYAALPRSTVPRPMPNQSLTTGLRGFSMSNGGICLVPLSMSAAASGGSSDVSTRLCMGHIRKLFDGFPQPIKSFPWKRVISSF
ncbi:hypothetical protein GW17_00034976 [Ensete ventricosum]|nr:hypothetical protein GW17_00034976 [Ensete ventricosum]RZR83039.1 hypothetical protein BHM03_00009588 [Ensete ventricosum]